MALCPRVPAHPGVVGEHLDPVVLEDLRDVLYLLPRGAVDDRGPGERLPRVGVARVPFLGHEARNVLPRSQFGSHFDVLGT